MFNSLYKESFQAPYLFKAKELNVYWAYSLFTFFSFIAWNYCGILFIICIALVFHILKQIEDKSTFLFWRQAYLLAFLFNISATFWLLEVSLLEGLSTFFANSLVMSIPLVVYSLLREKYPKYSLRFFILLWLSMEIVHTKWDLPWPWLTFGHVMGNQFYLIQWYSFIGVFGGSIWLIVSGYSLFQLVYRTNKTNAIKFILITTRSALSNKINFQVVNTSVKDKFVQILNGC